MWRWLPSVLCNKSSFCVSQRRIFFLQLCGLVFTVHLAILLLYGFIGWMTSGKDRFAISLHQQGATYVLMPLQKKVEQRNKNLPSVAGNSHKKSNVIDHDTYQRKKNGRKRASTMHASKKSAAAKSVQNLKKVAGTQTASIKVGSTKTGAPASLTLASTSRVTKSKKSAKTLSTSKHKKSSMKLQEVVQIEMVQPVEQLKVEEPKIQAPVDQPKIEQSEVEQPTVEQSEVEQPEIESMESAELEQDDDFDENNVVFVGYEELDQSVIGSKIQHTVQQYWTPPVGMHKDIHCEICVSIGADGHAVATKITKESGVFIYDASARKTLINIEYPKEVWNKTITIALGA